MEEKMDNIKSYAKKTLILFLAVGILFQSIGFNNLFNMQVKAEEATSSLTMSYLSNGTWNGFNSVIEASSIDGIKIQTNSSSSYYLHYRTYNQGNLNNSFYPYVNSNVDEFAGLSGQPIQQLHIQVYKNDGTKLESGIVVMYRVKVNNQWLSWVSNATPECMQSVQSKYNLGGTLDTDGYAGILGSNISGIEIHVFEEDSAALIDFSGEEAAPALSYMIDNSSNWTSFNNSVVTSHMDGIKIQTSSSKSYYLKYKTLNSGQSDYYSEVSSTSDDCAGWPGKPIQLLSIHAYSNNGTKLTSGIVVMYRAYVDGGWLPWVSNATPEYMLSVQSKYNLGGTLDTSGGYAGKTGSNISGIEIRIFEGNVSSIIDDMSGNEAEPSLSYMVNNPNIWTPFDRSVVPSTIDGIKIQTNPSKSYYLKYQANSYTAVDSRVNQYAGLEGHPIQSFSIHAYKNDGTKLTTGVVVMYRAYVDGEWLPWVSNADPEWMASAQVKYNLGGTLDTTGSYAGKSGSNISGIEIRVFEEKSADTQITPTGNYKIIQAPFISQNNRYITGCESVSTVMALNNLGINTSVDTFIDDYLYKTPTGAPFDPNVSFGGNPYKDGYGCYAPVIKNALDKALYGKGYYAKVLSNVSLQDLCSQYIDNNIPVILWATVGMQTPKNGNSWSYNGQTITWIKPEHCLLLVGYDDNNYIFNDPMKDHSQTYYNKAQVAQAYAGLYSQAVVILQGSESGAPSDPVNPTNPTEPQVNVKIGDRGDNVIWVQKQLNKFGYNLTEDGIFGNKTDLAVRDFQQNHGLTVDGIVGAQTRAALIQTNAPSVTPSNPIEYTKPSPIEESKCADPVDLSTGSHVIENSLMQLTGGKEIKLNANYNSSCLVKGSMGVGWYYNYEKTLQVKDSSTIWIYDNPSVYSVYSQTSNSNVFSCTSKGKNNYILKKQSDGTYVLNCNYDKTEYYDASGKLTKTEDRNKFVTNIEYTDNTVKITDALTNKNIFLTKDSSGKIIRIYDDCSREVILGYTNDCLSYIKDVNGNVLLYTYDVNGKIKTGTDANGSCYFENTYDANGRVIIQKDGISGSSPTLFSYGDNGQRIVTDRNGFQSTRVFNSDNQLVSYTDQNGNTRTFSYDAQLNLISEQDVLGNKITITYNTFNEPLVKTDKMGNKTKWTYDARGNVTSVIYVKKGDANDDGQITAKDLITIKYYIAGSITNINKTAADLNSDGIINSEDSAILKQYLVDPSVNLSDISEKYVYNDRNMIVEQTDRRGTTTTYTYDLNCQLTQKQTGSQITSYTYQNGFLVSKVDPMGKETVYNYNNIGQLSSTVDPQNHQTSYTYDKKGNVLEIQDALGNVIKNQYDFNDQKISSTDANGNKTWYSYNGNMKMVSITLPNGGVIKYDYDGEDRLIKTTDQYGKETRTVYDAAGRVIEKINSSKAETLYEYDQLGNVVKQTNPNGGTILNSYDANGNVISCTDSAGNVTNNEYDQLLRLSKTTNAMGGQTKYAYNSANDLTSVTDALGNKIEFTYDVYGNKLSCKDARGNSTTYTYDANNNLLTTTDALGHAVTNQYDDNNRIISTTDQNGYTTTFAYDVLGRKVSQTDPYGHTSSKQYDANGNVLTTTDEKGNVQSTVVYDSNNLPTSVTNATGNVTSNTYDLTGKLVSTIDSSNNKQSLKYDDNGNVVESTNQLGDVNSASYDQMGNITSLTGSLGGGTQYTYDSSGRLTTETTTSSGTISYGYNALNLKSSLTNARGQTCNYSYDLLGRITGYTNAEGTASFTYDQNGNVLTASDSKGTVTREYDALNRVTKYTNTNGQIIKYEYDNAGNLARMVYPDNTAVIYTHDKNNNLKTVTDWAGRVTTYTYDENNNVINVTKPDGSVTTAQYDTAQRVVSTVERSSGNVIITGYEYTYDALGRITCEKSLADNKQYEMTYDNLSRVTIRKQTDLTTNQVTQETYQYDSAGNITSYTLNQANGALVYDANNRLISYNGQQITYDADGNMTSGCVNGSIISMVYDSGNRLVSAGSNQYTYDVENNRITNVCLNDSKTYTYNTNAKLSQLLVVTDQSGSITKYVYGLGLIGQEDSNGFKTYHFDYRGSTTAITNATGAITDTFTYDTYGKLISRTGTTSTQFMYNGRDGVMTDQNGLLYMRARYYSPDLTRFVNADIIKGSITNSQTLNRYAYANGNPVSNIDPFGLSAERGTESKDNNDDRKKYINNYMSETQNPIFQLLKQWNISVTEGAINVDANLVDALWGGIKLNLNVSVSFQTSLDANISSDFSLDTGNAIHEATTPELRFPWADDASGNVGAYVDEERLSIGLSASVSSGEWEYKTMHQVGLYSEATILTITYTPDDILLPTITFTLDSEVNHLVKGGVAVTVLAATFAPEAIIAAAPSLAEVLSQLGNLSPSFSYAQ